ncbi:hypothetical protein [Larkinella rosea]|uniref:Glycosyltransferase RgtA/B/C/D-like domain-containing protein n=1 Tax=Larkinella rosea TaxID=2025312 RepID=A0A3P1C0X2_9BACT|nr:hypothetical protein [Larkinella rosea]RRB07061.1 hypothetical protein EHT25_04570 [Larkinella rosea]
MTKSSFGNYLSWFTGIASGFTVLFYVYYVAVYSVDFPFQDDNSLLQVIFELKKGLGWKHNLHTFFRTENDHRIFVPRLIGYLDYILTGHLNFKSYILLAAINLIAVCGFVFGLFRRLKLPFYYFLPIPFLIFQPQYHEVSIWALTGLQHITLLILLCGCLILLKKPSWGRVSIAVVLALLATFTHGNGIVVFATGGFLLLVEKHYKVLIPWIVSAIVAFGLYIADYTPGSGVESSINWPNLPASFVARIGANISVWQSDSAAASIIWGALICVLIIPSLFIFIYQSFNVRKNNSTFKNELFSFFCFILLTTFLITIFRASSTIVLENRFKIYAAFSSVFFYMFLINGFSALRKSLLIFFSGFALLFYISSYFGYTPEVANKNSRLVADTYNWRKHQTELCNTSSIESSLYFLQPAWQQGYWQVPDQFAGFDELVQATVQQRNFKPYTFRTQYFLNAGTNSPQLSIEIADFPLRRQSLRDNLFVVLHDETNQKTYLAGTLPKIAGRRQLLTQGTYFGPGFSTVIPLQAVRKGEYRLGCLLKKGSDHLELILSRQVINL